MSFNPLDRLVREYWDYDGPFLPNDPMVSYKYEKYDPKYKYPPDLARALEAELAAEEVFAREQEAAKKHGPLREFGIDNDGTYL